MPAFLEKKLKSEYGQNSATPYKVMNKLGYMKGNKETPLGAAAQAKHNAKMKLGPKAKKYKQPSVKLASLIKNL
jgi:hypothetical protein